MLLVHLPLAPPERVEQLERAHRSLPCLQVVEDALDAEGDGFEVVGVGRHVVDGAAKGADEEEGLEERVQVASGALVDKAVVSVLDGFVATGVLRTGVSTWVV